MKIKKILLLIVPILLLILVCFLYVHNREKMYSDLTYTQISFAYYNNGDRGANGCGHISSDEVKIGIISTDDNIHWEMKDNSITPSKLEYYLILDYLIHILDISNNNITDTNEMYEFYISAYMEDKDDNIINGTITLPYTSDFLTDIFVFVVTGMFYIRTIYPLIFLMYLSLGLLIYFATRKYFKDEVLSLKEQRKYLYSLIKPQSLFLLYSVIMLVLYEVIGTIKPIFWLSLLRRYHNPNMGLYGYYQGSNLIAGFIIIILEIVILWIIGNKNKRLYFSYAIPSIVMILIHKYLFKWYQNFYNLQNGFLNALKYRYIIFYETFPVHPKIFYFTLFFFMGLGVYFLFGFIANKSWRKNLAWSIAFATSNAGLTCMATYISQYVYRVLDIMI